MEVLFVRHGLAGERDPERWPDDRDRPLTSRGERRFRRMARRLRILFPRMEGIWSSPLTRAWQTAGILARETRWPVPQELVALEPGGRPEELLAFLRQQKDLSRAVLVGHEPALSRSISYFIAGSAAGLALEMKKGGVAAVRFPAEVKAGAGQLCALAAPRLLLRRRA